MALPSSVAMLAHAVVILHEQLSVSTAPLDAYGRGDHLGNAATCSPRATRYRFVGRQPHSCLPLSKARQTMKFGASVWPFKWDTPYDDGIRRIAKLGFKAIELIAWDREALDSYYTPATIKHLRSLLADEGLLLSEFVSTPRGMASPDRQMRDAAIEHFKRAAEVAVELGTSMINSVSSFPFEIAAPHITVLPHVQMFQVDYPPGLDWQQN